MIKLYPKFHYRGFFEENQVSSIKNIGKEVISDSNYFRSFLYFEDRYAIHNEPRGNFIIL